ncbi:MAG: acetyl-CoA decarbonylase/synthase complex subunit gamma [Candidatus Nezhaarchaeota archaeon]|nr:acetyl-CoA decarbonylase/synthase complex subunit gamma [Candidatus Nezhaarchaeota archaeon]MCX8142339.1 acetyl-CoA decarbonylase/synthase complex subunit gamma [Candidatus Nezhaarchaeota archaeon]MDW8050688.1 acetyl-CoA decarbonylase/synthase complex subunit gamma [Nitrososphaerota archaeon]
MPKIIRPLDVYKVLPQTNCGQCGESTCMAFAAKVADRVADIRQCKPLFEDPKYKSKLQSALELIRPPVKAVTIGVPPNQVVIGNKVVMYRHELTWYNPTAIAIDVTDDVDVDSLIKRAKAVEVFAFERIGQQLRLNLLALRCTSDSPEKFAKAADTLSRNTSLPLILCSYNPDVMEEALTVVGDKRPLIYAATKDNWREMLDLASKYKCPVTISSPGNLNMLKSLASTFISAGIEDIVLDPGTYVKGDSLAETVSMFTMLRRAAIEKEDKLVGFPLMAVPAVVWMDPEGDEIEKKMKESYIASILMTRYADLMVMHSLDPWVLMPILVWRQSVYTDPRVPPSVKPGLYEIGKPTDTSPVFATGNFALTYFLVRGDIENAKVDAYLVVADSEGLSVESSVAGRRLTAEKFAEAIKSSGLDGKLKKKVLVIPGRAARLSGELEELLPGWKVIVGPRDSSNIPEFIEKVLKKELRAT